jgi:ABC-type branched-subunit amino acid transport system ATPase component
MTTDHASSGGIVLSRLSKSYGAVRAVRSIDLAVAPGETVAILGPNGAGKTTTIDMVLGPTRPDYGFVVKDAPPEELADAIRRVVAGERVVDPMLAAATLASGVSPLTARERDVLVAARLGVTVAEMAGKLCLSEGTVRNYLSTAIAKTGTRNRAEAVRKADERGWL